MINRAHTSNRKATAMTIVVVLQALATLFFLLDFAGDVARDGIGRHLLIEGPPRLPCWPPSSSAHSRQILFSPRVGTKSPSPLSGVPPPN
jgi:hypothetical protein